MEGGGPVAKEEGWQDRGAYYAEEVTGRWADSRAGHGSHGQRLGWRGWAAER